jgi:hypothetical protein
MEAFTIQNRLKRKTFQNGQDLALCYIAFTCQPQSNRLMISSIHLRYPSIKRNSSRAIQPLISYPQYEKQEFVQIDEEKE